MAKLGGDRLGSYIAQVELSDLVQVRVSCLSARGLRVLLGVQEEGVELVDEPVALRPEGR